jgi:hypothetical protein
MCDQGVRVAMFARLSKDFEGRYGNRMFYWPGKLARTDSQDGFA